MGEPSGSSSVPNGTSSGGQDPLKRLSSFKSPRDLSLGGAKPNKKIFTPNLNVSRNKNKGPNLPTVTRDKRFNDKDRRDKKNDRNRNAKNGPNIIKSSGVFSEGLGAAQPRATRASYGGGRDTDSAPTLQKPFIRVKDFGKIDKDLEQQKINKVLGDGAESDEEAPDDTRLDKEAPIRLPLSDEGWLHSKSKVAMKIKQEIVIKDEPEDGENIPLSVDTKPEEKKDVKKEPYDDMDIVSLLRSDKSTLIMLQFPDSLPGRGAGADDEAPRRKQSHGNNTEGATVSNEEQPEEKPVDNRCRLSELQEGQIGKLLIHRSGRVRLALGDTMFEVAAGTQASFRQEVVSMEVDDATRSANLVALGSLPHKLNLLPHWETMLADMAL